MPVESVVMGQVFREGGEEKGGGKWAGLLKEYKRELS